MKILVTGASGLIGRELIYKLLTSGHEVRALARSPQSLAELPKGNVFPWSDNQIPPASSIQGCDVVIHLAGEGIADKYWTRSRKQRLWDSRVVGTKNLVSAIKGLASSDRPKVLISGSAIGFYGSSDGTKSEEDPQGKGFLADLCSAWEKEANEAKDLGLRVVNLRTGLVLSKHGGVLAKTGPVILGAGKQWMSWIHIDDLVNFIIFAMEKNDLHGPYNLTSPNPTTNSEYTKAVSKARGIPFTVKAPAFLLKTILGEMSEAILANQKITPEKTMRSGFRFKFENLKNAVDDLLGERS